MPNEFWSGRSLFLNPNDIKQRVAYTVNAVTAVAPVITQAFTANR